MPNRLADQASPYLRQHATNPIDWYPWGPEAKSRAQQEDRPLFLSIGYAACHWCHVMERESFRDPRIAAALSADYVAIKVDREERPDIDHAYMTACQMLTGLGGWPLTVICTPEGEPFFAGTYFPPRAVRGRPGLLEILTMVAQAWREDRRQLLESAAALAERVRALSGASAAGSIGSDTFSRATHQLASQFDREYGGFGPAPRFPMPSTVGHLLRSWAADPQDQIRTMIEHTIAGMYRGGLFDHVGHGFARYATDRKWLVPHFEQMLYDNAQMAMLATEAYLAFGRPVYRRIADWTLDWMDRELGDPSGGFCSSLDADAGGIEGRHWTLTPKEVRRVLGDQAGRRWCERFGVTESGHLDGRSVPNLLSLPISQILDSDAPRPEDDQWEPDRLRLLEARKKGPLPARDDKVLLGWNGLAIAALARTSRAMGQPERLERARRACDFVEEKLRRPDGRLLLRYRDGDSGIPAFLFDYAAYAWACLELAEADPGGKYRERAENLASDMLRLFGDDGRLYMTGSDAEQVLGRQRELGDGVIPAGTSLAAYVLLRLGHLTGDERWRTSGERVLDHEAGSASERPAGFTFLLSAARWSLTPGPTIEIAGPSDDSRVAALCQVVDGKFLPQASLRWQPDSEPAAHVCREGTCLPPVTTPGDLEKLLVGYHD